MNFEQYSDDESEESIQIQGSKVVQDEMYAYKVEKNPDNLPCLQWWQRNSGKYPNMSITARRILAVRATSSEAERDFSAAG